jgi:hypothetical protein
MHACAHDARILFPPPKCHRFVSGQLDVEVPVAAVQQLPEAMQATAVLGTLGALGLSTVALCTLTDLSWAQGSSGPYVLGVVFTLAGVSHFTVITLIWYLIRIVIRCPMIMNDSPNHPCGAASLFLSYESRMDQVTLSAKAIGADPN